MTRATPAGDAVIQQRYQSPWSIVSDGTVAGTHIKYKGEPIGFVQNFKFEASMKDSHGILEIKVAVPNGMPVIIRRKVPQPEVV